MGHPSGTPPKMDVSTPERKAAVRSAQKEFALKAIDLMMARKGQEQAAAEKNVVKAEFEAREKDPAVRSAYEAWDQARAAYESACDTAITGHSDLSRQAAALRASVDRDVAVEESGQTADTNAITRTLQQLTEVTKALSELERKAIYEQPQPEVKQAHEAVTAAYATYRQSLDANATYKSEMGKRAAVRSEYTNLVTRQGEISSEN